MSVCPVDQISRGALRKARHPDVEPDAEKIAVIPVMQNNLCINPDTGR